MIWLLLLIGLALWLIANYWLKSLFFNTRFFWICGIVVFMFIAAFFYPGLFTPAKVIAATFVLLLVTDGMFLFAFRGKPEARRLITERMSNGDNNPVTLLVKNTYPFTIRMHIIDELPEQFQARNHFFADTFSPHEEKKFSFHLRPVERGEYHFGNLMIYTSSLLGFLSRKFVAPTAQMIPVYPSYFQMRKYE